MPDFFLYYRIYPKKLFDLDYSSCFQIYCFLDTVVSRYHGVVISFTILGLIDLSRIANRNNFNKII